LGFERRGETNEIQFKADYRSAACSNDVTEYGNAISCGSTT